MTKEEKVSVHQSSGKGKSFGGLVQSRIDAVNKLNDVLKETPLNTAFVTLGETINSWLLGQVKIVATGDVNITGDPEKTYALCKGDGLSINELKNLQGKALHETLPVIQGTVADLTYLLMKNAVVVEEITYTPPGFTSIESILDLKDITRRFPKETLRIVEEGQPGGSECVPIVAVDVVCLVLDYARTKA
jgi:hypothetical protein